MFLWDWPTTGSRDWVKGHYVSFITAGGIETFPQIIHELKRTLWAAGPTGQYLYINIWRTLPGIVVVQGHHPPGGHWILTHTSSVPLCGGKKQNQQINDNFKHDGIKYNALISEMAIWSFSWTRCLAIVSTSSPHLRTTRWAEIMKFHFVSDRVKTELKLGTWSRC